ncbi:response regulator [Vallitalea pronyensis]|uniref:Stage 0 sporulation protein A homolog n=1 Tax=Vallitalea pronyensis TaxID=1348613 RepID=A0A8J8SG42_9FIRM|nr:response regulator [Vallitalea pronyensis]QUI21989.1 response regulator [Vallitalea pronyensis]
MYNVLIVEDEPPILRGICNAVQQADLDFTVAATALNGQDAVDLLKENTYDLVITDINMPIKDGFYVLDYIAKNNLDTVSIILSGYQEFDYAKKALKYKVYDYLVKPIDKQQLKKILVSIDQYICAQNKEKKREKMFSSLHTNGYMNHMNEALAEKCFMLLLCAGSFPITGFDSMTPGSSLWHKYHLESILHHMIDDNFTWVINGITPAEQIMIIAGNATTCNSLSKSIFNVLTQQEIPITMAISKQIDNYSQIYATQNTLRNFMCQHMIFGNSSIMHYNPNTETPAPLPLFDEQKLRIVLDYNDVTKTRKAVHHIIATFKDKQITQQEMQNELRKILYLIHASSDHSKLNIETVLNEVIVNSFNYNSLTKNMDVLICSAYNKTTLYSSDKKILVKDIQLYIEKHLADQISNQILSEKFGLVPSYISTIFKSFTNTTLSEYIINKRVEKAKELLLSDANLLAKDVAKLVGYTDPLYFSKVFKKKTGYYPSKYKDRH